MNRNYQIFSSAVKKGFRGMLLGAALAIAFAASMAIQPVSASAAAAPSTGSITVCKMIWNGNSNNGSGSFASSSTNLPDGTFKIGLYYAGPLSTSTGSTLVATSTFSASSFSADTAIFGSDKNAECVTENNLSFGYYHYTEEAVSGTTSTSTNMQWKAPQYNDQYDTSVTSLNDFLAFSTTTNTNSDGVVSIGSSRTDRTIVVLNSFGSSTPTTTPSSGGSSNGGGSSSGGGGGSSSSLRISDEAVNGVIPGTALVTWSTNKDASTQVFYGTTSVSDTSDSNYGYPFSTIELSDSTTTHSMGVSGLTPGMTYYFRPVSTSGSRTAVGDEVKLSPQGASGSSGSTGSSISCSYLNSFLKIGQQNDPIEVKKLQIFLSSYEGYSNVQVTGVFDQATFAAVEAFQEKYASDILTPWGYAPNQPTGYVYLLTRKKINEVVCNSAFPLTAQQQQEVTLYRAMQLSLQNNGIANPAAPSAPAIPGTTTGQGETGSNVAAPTTITPASTSTAPGVTPPGSNNGLVVDQTGTGATQTASSTLGRGALGNLTAAIFSLPQSGTDLTRCIFNLIIILAIIYIITSILVNGEDASEAARTRAMTRRLWFYLAGVIIAIAFALFFDMYCLIVPLLIALIILIVFLIVRGVRGRKPRLGLPAAGGAAQPLVVEKKEEKETKQQAKTEQKQEAKSAESQPKPEGESSPSNSGHHGFSGVSNHAPSSDTSDDTE